MFFKRKIVSKAVGFRLGQVIIFLIISLTVTAQNNGNATSSRAAGDTTLPNGLPYPIYDKRGDFLSNGARNTYDFNKPSNFTDSVSLDFSTQLYTLYEKIGDKYYQTPTTYTFEEYWKLRGRQSEIDYFKKRSNTMSLLNRKLVKPKLSLYDNLFNRLFGNGKIEIIPQGNLDITLGYQGQNINNPTLPEKARKNGGLDFGMNAQVNVIANIGDKLKFPINYNTIANFGQDNQLKLDYVGFDDEVIKRFEAGAVQFQSRSNFIPGAQQLFGLKTQLQFGKLNITAVLANQKSTRQTANLQGGASAQLIDLKGDEYEENRHFLLSQYFENNYNSVMSTLPAVTTPVQILRLEVWVTNKNGSTVNTRDIVGLMDLGEIKPYLQPPVISVTSNFAPPDNGTNNEYSNIISNAGNRNPALVVSNLQTMGLTPVQDFEKTFARKLDSSQYIFNRQVGYISLSQPLQADEVLAVAFQYAYNGRIYRVGEFSSDLPPDSTTATQQVLFLKLLKATSQRTKLPIWQLMMKNVYAVGYGSLTPTDFKLNVLYQQPSLGAKRYFPFGDKNLGTPLIALLNLDRLNNNQDPQPDGEFDYVEGYTVLSPYSRIIFPVLQPFGRDLASKVYNVVPAGVRDTLYYALYDSIKAVAQQFPGLNRFLLKGSARTSGSSDISIGYNIPRGSVTVTAGGQTLIEGTDYNINYDLGTIKVTNQAILNAGLPVQVNFENNAGFGIQQKKYFGLRLDYLAKNTLKERLAIGGTIVQLSERPYFTKNNIGDDPIKNTMYGMDVNYSKEVPRITKLLDKLPYYSTTVPSNINLYAEGAYLQPGHAPQIGKGTKGAIYIDDFEGSESAIDLRFPANSWVLASTPQGATDIAGLPIFPESNLNNNLLYGRNRAKMAWYQIEPALQIYKGSNNPLGNDKDELSDPQVRLINQNEIFPLKTVSYGQNQLITFDLSYYPNQKGPYNYDISPGSIDANNNLKNPEKRWGGLMRNIDQTDFETANVQFIEFWLQDPYIKSQSSTSGGKLYFNLGTISEDVLKDGRRFYENGLPTPNAPAPVDSTTVWGVAPLNPLQVTNAFSNNAEDRPYQDVGFDGLNDDNERKKRASYLSALSPILNGAALQQVQSDPSLDNYIYYRNSSFTSSDGILKRYKNINNPQGNSQVNDGSSTTSAATLYPDAEDVNKDNTMNESESYFQYIVDIKPQLDPSMQIGVNYIVDKKVVPVKLVNGTTRNETWYQFRIPISAYNKNVNNIPDFKSIRFIRMFLTDFTDSVVLRFGELQFTRNTWRNFQSKIDSTGTYTPITTNVDFVVGAVNIEENELQAPLNYRTPLAIQREQYQSNNGFNLFQNEQSMTLKFCGMGKNDGRGVFQTFTKLDIRQYGNLNMYMHLENNVKTPNNIKNKDLNAVIRIGTDFISNYYEITAPLYITPLSANTLDPNSAKYNDTLWPAINNLNVDLSVLPNLKLQRNIQGSPTSLFSILQPNGQTYSIMGEPNLGEIRGVLIGVQNVNNPNACGQVWVNELRLTSINEKGGWAAMARIDMNLADLGTLTGSVFGHSSGFGTLEQKIEQRYVDDLTQFDVATNLELGKLLPKSAAISIPVFASYSQTLSKPHYDPYALDITLKQNINASPASEKDSISNNAVTFSSTKTVNFTNVRKNRTGNKKPKIYDIENIDVSFSYIDIQNHTPLIESNQVKRYRAGLGYNYAPHAKYIEPFKKMKFFKKQKTHWFDLIKDFNFNPIPTQLSFRGDAQRQFGAVTPRSVGSDKYIIPTTYDKYFTMQRDYILRWPFTRSINFDFTATNNSRVDEPYGAINTQAKKDTVWKNFISGGRNTLYNQTVNLSYNFPTAKLPLIDWTTLNFRYQAIYRWIGASRLAIPLGNIIENGQSQEATAQFDLTRLYSKSKFFKAIDQPRVEGGNKNTTTRIDTIYKYVTKNSVKVKEVKRLKTVKVKDPNAMPDIGTMGRVFGKLVSSLKQVNVSVSENGNTRLPGYMDSAKVLGRNWQSSQPDLDFVLGRQPDTAWLNNASKKGLISTDSNFNTILQQNYDQQMLLTAQIEPVRDFTISLNMNKTFSKNYSELFKDTTGTGNNFGHLSPYTGGNFNISYIFYKTLFGKFDANKITDAFQKFENNRQVISERVGMANKYNTGKPADAAGYQYGYNRYATDVLIPAFIAAYSGQDPNTIALIQQSNPNIKFNPYKGYTPKPNWKLDYTGLSQIKGLQKTFTNITISHAYNASLSMNGFTSALLYEDSLHYRYPSFYDTISKNYIPYFLVPNITITEQFAPLVGIDVMFTNQLQLKIDYLKQRTISLSLIDFQLSEALSTEFAIGVGYRKRGLKLLGGLKLPKFLSKTGSGKLDNEIAFRFDMVVRDNITINSRLDQEATLPTGGSKEISIIPTIDYYLNSRVNLKFYFEERKVTPYVSSSAPITNIRAGVQVRISLAQ